MDFDYIYSSYPVNTISAIITVVILWRIFTKAGEKGWKAIIPFYNIYVLFELTWGSGIKFLFLLIPFFNFYVIIKTCLNVARAFGKGGGYATGLFFLSPIFGLIIAFSDMEYLGVPKKVNGTVTYTKGPGQYNNPNMNEDGPKGYYNQEPEQTNTTTSYAGTGSKASNNTYSYTKNNSNTNQGNEGTTCGTEDKAQAPVITPVLEPTPTPESKAEPKQKVCPNCGTAVQSEDKFCPTCGGKLN